MLNNKLAIKIISAIKDIEVVNMTSARINPPEVKKAFVLYDDRIDFYFNFKDNAKSLTLSELNTVSDLSSSSPP